MCRPGAKSDLLIFLFFQSSQQTSLNFAVYLLFKRGIKMCVRVILISILHYFVLIAEKKKNARACGANTKLNVGQNAHREIITSPRRVRLYVVIRLQRRFEYIVSGALHRQY